MKSLVKLMALSLVATIVIVGCSGEPAGVAAKPPSAVPAASGGGEPVTKSPLDRKTKSDTEVLQPN